MFSGIARNLLAPTGSTFLHHNRFKSPRDNLIFSVYRSFYQSTPLSKELIVSTSDHIPGKNIIAVKGFVRGIGPDQSTWFRKAALDQMIFQAIQIDADAVVSVRYSRFDRGFEDPAMLCYGTAVMLDKPFE